MCTPSVHIDKRKPGSSNKALLIVIAPAALTFAISHFAFDSIAMRIEEFISTGVWVVLVAVLFVVLTVSLMTHLLGKIESFEEQLMDTLMLLGIVLYVIYVAVTGGVIQSLWMVAFAANALLDLLIISRLAIACYQFGTWASRFACLALALKELFTLTAIALVDIVPEYLMSTISLVLLLALIACLALKMVHTLLKETKEPALNHQSIIENYIQTLKQVSLTNREEEVLHLLLQGSSYVRIAKKLNIADSTVKTHANHIYEKLAVDSRDELIESFVQHSNG